MSEENESSSEGEGIKNLRSQYDAIKAEREQLAAELATYRAEKRQQSVAEALKAKGLDGAKAAKAAALYNGDDASEDAVGKWLESYADVFNVQSQSDDSQNSDVQRVSAASFGTADSNVNGPKGRVLGDPAEIQRALDNLPKEELERLGYMPKNGIAGARWR